MFPLQSFLCGWYVYLSVLSFLMALSAGPRTLVGRVALIATVVPVLLAGALFWPLPVVSSVPVLLGAKWFVLAVGAVGIGIAPRQDTKLIALLLTAAAALPLYLHHAL